jgi:glutathione S-transferase
VALDPQCVAYCETIMALPEMSDWVRAALEETEKIEELDAEF